jgi:2Fe-2S ferredoxin
MPQVTYVHPDGRRDVLDIPVGTSVMQAALANDIEGIIAECGGSLMCATCHVYVEEADLARTPELGPVEDEMLDCAACERRPNSRLSCQLVMTPEMEELVVHLPESQV